MYDIFHQKHHFKKGDTMKFNKIILILIIAIILSFTGCFFNDEHKYTFAQSSDNIVSVEIRKLEYGQSYTTPEKTRIIKTLNEDEATTLLRDISEAEFGEAWGDGIGASYGDIVVYITYSDGICEVIGYSNCAIIEKKREWSFTGEYFKDSIVFTEIMYEYVGEEYRRYLPGYPLKPTVPPTSQSNTTNEP